MWIFFMSLAPNLHLNYLWTFTFTEANLNLCLVSFFEKIWKGLLQTSFPNSESDFKFFFVYLVNFGNICCMKRLRFRFLSEKKVQNNNLFRSFTCPAQIGSFISVLLQGRKNLLINHSHQPTCSRMHSKKSPRTHPRQS